MNRKIQSLLICTIFFMLLTDLQAQKRYFGFFGGLGRSWNVEDIPMNNLFLGVVSERKLNHAPLSFETGVNFITGINYVEVPLIMNLILGKETYFKFSGGILPTLRLSENNSGNVFVIGFRISLGPDIPLSENTLLFARATLDGLPNNNIGFTNSRSSTISNPFTNLLLLSAGLKFSLSH